MPAASEPAALLLTELAPAKVNLFLRVVGRRADGYHLLESLAVFAGAADVLHAEELGGACRPPQPCDKKAPRHPGEASIKASPSLFDVGSGGGGSPHPAFSLSLAGPFSAGLAAEPDNLVLRAARSLAAVSGGCGAALALEKHLPVASGIGGGSADAAAALRVLARLWGVLAADGALAVRLGADVPVCLASVPRMMRGIGDALSPAPGLPPYGLALVNPGVGVSTAEIFRARQGGYSAPVKLPDAWPDAAAMARDLAVWGNDLQAPAITLCPAIDGVLRALAATPGCLLAQMSGSGATCFGLFATPGEAAAAVRLLARPGWWSWGGAPFAAAGLGG